MVSVERRAGSQLATLILRENQEIIVLFTANSSAVANPGLCRNNAYVQQLRMGAPWIPPQQTDGTQLLTATITPKRAANKLRVQARIPFTATSPSELWFALFRDNAAAAFYASVFNTSQNNAGAIAVLEAEIVAGTTMPTTMKLRYGNVKGGNQTFGSMEIAQRAGWAGPRAPLFRSRSMSDGPR